MHLVKPWKSIYVHWTGQLVIGAVGPQKNCFGKSENSCSSPSFSDLLPSSEKCLEPKFGTFLSACKAHRSFGITSSYPSNYTLYLDLWVSVPWYQSICVSSYLCMPICERVYLHLYLYGTCWQEQAQITNSSLKFMDNKRKPKKGLNSLGLEAREPCRNRATFSINMSSVPPHVFIGSCGCRVRWVPY